MSVLLLMLPLAYVFHIFFCAPFEKMRRAYFEQHDASPEMEKKTKMEKEEETFCSQKQMSKSAANVVSLPAARLKARN